MDESKKNMQLIIDPSQNTRSSQTYCRVLLAVRLFRVWLSTIRRLRRSGRNRWRCDEVSDAYNQTWPSSPPNYLHILWRLCFSKYLFTNLSGPFSLVSTGPSHFQMLSPLLLDLKGQTDPQTTHRY